MRSARLVSAIVGRYRVKRLVTIGVLAFVLAGVSLAVTVLVTPLGAPDRSKPSPASLSALAAPRR